MFVQFASAAEKNGLTGIVDTMGEKYLQYAAAHLPNTERVCAGVLVLLTGETVTPGDIERACEIIRLSVENGGELMRLLEKSPYRVHREMAC